MEVWSALAIGFGVALQPVNLAYCFMGVFIGTLIGVLPGIGPVAAMSLLMPLTFVKILHDGFKKASEMPESLAVLKKLEQEYLYMNTADYTAHVKQQIDAYRRALDAMGITKK